MNTILSFVTLFVALYVIDYLYEKIPITIRNSPVLQIFGALTCVALVIVAQHLPSNIRNLQSPVAYAISAFIVVPLAKFAIRGPLKLVKWAFYIWLFSWLVSAIATKYHWWHNLGSFKYVIVALVITFEVYLIYRKVIFLRIRGALHSWGTSAYLAPMYEFERRTFTKEQQVVLDRDRKIYEAKRKVKQMLQLFAETLFAFSLGGFAIWVLLNLF